jgi:hypothetical protein
MAEPPGTAGPAGAAVLAGAAGPTEDQSVLGPVDGRSWL